ncbi:MAG: 23S rRNA (guanosine(2251)-2'-O)-methyltransferase RlmB [Pseudomonadota bacterium]
MKNNKNNQRPDLFGTHAVREAYLNPNRNVEALLLTAHAKDGFEDTLNEARAKALKRPSPQIIDKDKLDKMLPKGSVHQGIALICSGLEQPFIQDFIIKGEQKDNMLLLMLDQVTDPHNVGAILRSACAFGVDGVIMQRKHAPDLTGVLAKTACGAVEHVPVAFETNLSRALEELKENFFFTYGLDERGEMDIGDIKPGGKTVLVLGAEGPGLRRLVGETCDALVKLPMHGPMPSINVSNAAAVALYALSA